MQANSLWWFASQQQSNTFWRQKLALFDLKFSSDFNGFVPKSWKWQEVHKNG